MQTESDENLKHTPIENKKSKRQVSLSTFVTVLVLGTLIAFVLGSRSDQLLARIPLINKQSSPASLDLTSLQSVYDVLRENYDGELDPQKLVEGAKRGMVQATGDPYTVFFSDTEAEEFFKDLEGSFSGIGAELGIRDKRVYVVSTIDDSPAKKSGLAAGDILLSVNDQDASTWSIDKAVSEIRGEKGTSVKLNVLRGNEPKEFSITRDVINNPSVTSEVRPDGIGILRISRFGENETVQLANAAAQDFKSKNVKGVILDLRGNGGGYLRAARDIASIWLDDKPVVTERRGDTVIENLKSNRNPVLGGVPLVVLVDGGSASASEILAGALRDNNAAKLIGEKTFGKGSVQQFEELPGGGQLKVTVAKWYTPSGKNISKEGITPDIKIENTLEDINSGRDPQKDKALEALR